MWVLFYLVIGVRVLYKGYHSYTNSIINRIKNVVLSSQHLSLDCIAIITSTKIWSVDRNLRRPNPQTSSGHPDTSFSITPLPYPNHLSPRLVFQGVWIASHDFGARACAPRWSTDGRPRSIFWWPDRVMLCSPLGFFVCQLGVTYKADSKISSRT